VVLTSTYVTRDGAPILLVSRESDDDGEVAVFAVEH
jgi:hypothetical protein